MNAGEHRLVDPRSHGEGWIKTPGGQQARNAGAGLPVEGAEHTYHDQAAFRIEGDVINIAVGSRSGGERQIA